VQDVALRLAAVAAVALLLPLTGCVGAPEGWSEDGPAEADGDAPTTRRPAGRASASTSAPATVAPSAGPSLSDVIAGWEQERDAAGPMGTPVQFDLRGDLQILGDLEAGARDLVVRPTPIFPSDDTWVFFPNATVTGFGAGHVILNATELRLTSAAPMWYEPQSFQPTPAPHPVAPRLAFAPSVPLGDVPGWEDANRSAFFARPYEMDIAGATVSGHTAAVLVQNGAAVPLPAAFVLDAAQIRVGRGAGMEAPALDLRAPSVEVVAPTLVGTVDAGSAGSFSDVQAVLGTDAWLRLEGDRLTTVQPLQATQVLDQGRPLLPAAVELVPESSTVEVGFNETRWVRVAYRESGYRGAAVLDNLTVTGPAAGAVRVGLDAPPTHVDEVIAVLDELAAFEGSPLLPFVALALGVTVGIAAAVVGFAEAIGCFFSGCPERYPYPTWMAPGETGVFYFQVQAGLPPGEHDVALTFEGANHEPVSLPLRIVVS
jgi:hypothetical protein